MYIIYYDDPHNMQHMSLSLTRIAPTPQAQMLMDVGQRALGFTMCTECGMGYVAGVQADMEAHTRHHALMTSDISFPVCVCVW